MDEKKSVRESKELRLSPRLNVMCYVVFLFLFLFLIDHLSSFDGLGVLWVISTRIYETTRRYDDENLLVSVLLFFLV